MVTFDSGSLARLGDLETDGQGGGRARSSSTTTSSNQRYGTINVIDPDAAASGVLVRRLDRPRSACRSTRDAAVCLYAALVCDTGRFQYESTTPAVFELAARARRVSTCRSPSCRARCSRSTASRTCSCSPTCSRTRELVAEKQFVWTKVTQADLARHGVTFEEVEGLIDVVRRTREAEVVVRAEGSARRHVARQPAFARRRRRVPHRRARRAAAATASRPASRATSPPTPSSRKILAAL